MKRFAAYIVLGKSPKGEIFGYSEYSFSMGLEKNRVRVERSFEWSYSAKEKGLSERLLAYRGVKGWADKLNARDTEGYVYKAFRVGSKNCPVKIDWSEMIQMKKVKKYDKFKWRNLPFKLKENVTF